MRLKPVVEGYGETEAVRTLARRLALAEHLYSIKPCSAIRAHRSDFENEHAFKKLLTLARLDDPDGILIIFDGDGACPAKLVAEIMPWLAEANPIPCEVVIANQEYEAWFLASITSLRGHRGIKVDASVSKSPEEIPDAKGAISSLMEPGRTYIPTADQDALTQLMDLNEASQNSRSFRRVQKAMRSLIDRFLAT